MNDIFPEVIGQERVKKRLSFFLDGFYQTKVFPNLLYVGPKGEGKSFLSRALAKRLKIDGGPKSLIEINCSTMKSVSSFFNHVVIPHIIDRDVTIFFDEASEIPKSLTMALLTILEPNDDYFNYFTFDGVNYRFDFRKVTFIFATSEPQKVFPALQSRLERVDLEDYTISELGRILKRGLNNIAVSQDLLEHVAVDLRSNARCAAVMARHVQRLLKIKRINYFNYSVWNELKESLDIKPLGLNQTEIKVLKYLSEREETSLTTLASKLGMTKESVQRDAELFLMKHNLIEIRQRGRSLTPAGIKYLMNIA